MDKPNNPLKRILIITETSDQETLPIAIIVIKKLHKSNLFTLYSEDHLTLQTLPLEEENGTRTVATFDYIISIGENQTMMRSLRFNKDGNNSPVISISNGNEPIMSSYSFCDIDEVIDKFIKL